MRKVSRSRGKYAIGYCYIFSRAFPVIFLGKEKKKKKHGISRANRWRAYLHGDLCFGWESFGEFRSVGLGWVKLLGLFTALQQRPGFWERRMGGREREGSREPRGAEWWGRKCTRVERISRVDDTVYERWGTYFAFSKAIRFPMRARRFVLPRALAACTALHHNNKNYYYYYY